MGNRFASGKRAIAECDRCGFRYLLKELRKETVKTKEQNLLVCWVCWNPDHPQLQLGMYPVDDPQAVRNPRPDQSYYTSGLLADGYNGEGSRNTQWGWNPVGGAAGVLDGLTPNNLIARSAIGTVSVN